MGSSFLAITLGRQAGSWCRKNDNSHAILRRSGHTMVVVNDMIFSVGGYSGIWSEQLEADGLSLHYLERETLQFKPVFIRSPQMPANRYSHAATVYLNDIVVWGGLDTLTHKPIPGLFIYDTRKLDISLNTGWRII